jgi:hypothetical protein
MRTCWSVLTVLVLIFSLLSCEGIHPRPRNVPYSAVWVDNTFVDCFVEPPFKANRCTVYKDNSGDILAEGLFVLDSTDVAADKSELRYAAFGDQVIYLDDLRRLRLRAPSPRDPSRRIFHARLKSIASKNGAVGVDCGNARATGSADLISECVFTSVGHKTAFYASYYRQAYSSFSYAGIAGDADGSIYEAFYSGGPTVWMGGAGKDGQILDGNHTLVVRCPKPTKLTERGDGTLTCFRPVIN